MTRGVLIGFRSATKCRTFSFITWHLPSLLSMLWTAPTHCFTLRQWFESFENMIALSCQGISPGPILVYVGDFVLLSIPLRYTRHYRMLLSHYSTWNFILRSIGNMLGFLIIWCYVSDRLTMYYIFFLSRMEKSRVIKDTTGISACKRMCEHAIASRQCTAVGRTLRKCTNQSIITP